MCIRDSPNEYKAHFNYANLYIDNGHYIEAIDQLKNAISCNENFPEADHRIGEVHQYIFQTNRDTANLKHSIEWFKKSDKNAAKIPFIIRYINNLS